MIYNIALEIEIDTMKELRKDIREKLEARYPGEVIVNDGILDEEIFQRQPMKVMFLLKETYGDYNNIIGPQDIFNGKSSPFWTNIYNWTCFVNQFYIGVPPIFRSKADILEQTKCVDNIAYVNVKKVNCNQPISNKKDILKHAEIDTDILKKQIDSINPDVIFTSSTTFEAYQIIFNLLIGDFKNVKRHTCKGQNFLYAEHKQRKIIKLFHPSCFALNQRGVESTLLKLLE